MAEERQRGEDGRLKKGLKTGEEQNIKSPRMSGWTICVWGWASRDKQRVVRLE